MNGLHEHHSGRLVVVLGAGHSGTTILYRMLSAHPDATWLSQFSQRGGEIPGRFRLPGGALFERGLRRLLPHDWRKQGGRAQWLVPTPGEGHAIWNHLLPEHQLEAPEAAISAVNRLVDQECAQFGSACLVVKLPRLYRQLRILARVRADSRFLHIVRDGRAVALSMQAKYRSNVRDETEALNAAARVWCDQITAVDEVRAGVALHELRYEDFCADVHRHLVAALEFIGLEPDRYPFDRVPATLGVTNARWFDDAAAPSLAAVEAVQHDALARFGYVPRRDD